MVTLSTTTQGALIRYTDDGSTPTETAGKSYKGAIPVTSNTTIKAIAYQSQVDSNVSTGVYNITITGDFAIQASPSSQLAAIGQTATYTLNLIPISGFSGSIGLRVDPNSNVSTCSSITSIPAGLTVGTPASVSITPQRMAAGCQPGSALYLILQSVSQAGTHSVTLEVDIPFSSDFSIAAQSSSQTLSTAGSAFYQLQLSPVGTFAGQVSLALTTALPPGATWSIITPQPVSVDGLHTNVPVMLQVTSPVSIPSFTVTATSGSITHSAPLSLVVQAGAPNPATLINPPNGSTLIGGATAHFSWNAGSGAQEYALDLSFPDGTPFFSQSTGTNQQVNVVLPAASQGSALVVTVRTRVASDLGSLSPRGTYWEHRVTWLYRRRIPPHGGFHRPEQFPFRGGNRRPLTGGPRMDRRLRTYTLGDWILPTMWVCPLRGTPRATTSQ